jgi:hypothetical protein
VENEVAGETGWISGLSENYLRVHVINQKDAANHILRIRLRKTKGQVLLGEVIT